MVQYKTIFTTIGVILLLFFGIPIRVNPPTISITNNDKVILFSNYIDKFNKTYRNNGTLRSHKFAAFQNTMKEIEQLNSKRQHNLSAIFGFTKFSDMSKEEFLDKYLQDDLYERILNKTKYMKRSSSEENDDHNLIKYSKRSVNDLPMKIDWRTKQVVTKINNQKYCGACWAFSTVETVESMRAIKNGILEKLSVQELIDCAGYDNNGCAGGDICTLLYWLVDNSVGIEKDEEYPLHWRTESCKLNKTKGGVQIADFACNSFVDNEDQILQLLANHGPVAVAINALLWQNYLGGVIHYHCDGDPSLLNHAVQLVGYDRTAEVPYYIVRNSWGTDFGDKGYLYIAIGSNMCGLANEVTNLDVI